MKRLALLVCLVAVPLAIFATAQEPYQGDFDLDGDVDFTDFLTFASNYGKTGGSTTPSTQVDTVWVVVRDTIYIDGDSGGSTDNGGGGNQGTQADSLDAPTGLAGIHVLYFLWHQSSAVEIRVLYLDNAQNVIREYGKIWRNPDKVTVTINRRQGDGYREVYRSNTVNYKRHLYVSDTQTGIYIDIPGSEIPIIYADMRRIPGFDFPNVFQIWVTVEFDGVEYRALAGRGHLG